MYRDHRTALPNKQDNTRMIWIIGTIILVLQLAFHLTVGATEIARTAQLPDSVAVEMDKQLHDPQFLKELNFPQTVQRFYINPMPVWINDPKRTEPILSAMLLLDCVKQFGLQRKDYHAQVLTYETMRDAFSPAAHTPARKRAEFELMLTDAMISMINHLHYGAFNPDLNNKAIDSGTAVLKAEEWLHNAIVSPDVMAEITKAQPVIAQYKQLQGYMKLIVGQYTCDAYETSETDVRRIALNMERLRWASTNASSYIHINIPAYALAYCTPDSVYDFKVIVGKAETPTPSLISTVTFMETGPDWKVPASIFIKELLPKAEKDAAYFENNHLSIYDKDGNFVIINPENLAKIRSNPKLFQLRQTAGCDNALGRIVFRFSNSHDIYLHDTPEQQYFSRTKRALSHGCIRVQQPEKLAQLLLKNDGQSSRTAALNTAMAAYKKQEFALKTPLPILITYLTVTVKDGMLLQHEDIYQLDSKLEKMMFGFPETQK